MNLKELAVFIDSKKKEYVENRERIALLSALDTAALMKRRVINERQNADGGIFGVYSEKYQKTRQSRNLLGDNVNFSFTNKMWNSTTARIISVNSSEIVVLISPDGANVYKMIHNTERFGTILELNEKEQEIHRSIYQDRINDL